MAPAVRGSGQAVELGASVSLAAANQAQPWLRLLVSEQRFEECCALTFSPALFASQSVVPAALARGLRIGAGIASSLQQLLRIERPSLRAASPLRRCCKRSLLRCQRRKRRAGFARDPATRDGSSRRSGADQRGRPEIHAPPRPNVRQHWDAWVRRGSPSGSWSCVLP